MLNIRLTLIAALTVLAAQAALADSGPYTIKQSTPSEGSNLRKPIVLAGSTPLNKSYADLTPEQQAGLKADYDKMGPGDEPPFPDNGLMNLYKAVAAVHEKLGLAYKGPLTMRVDVDANGTPTRITTLESPDEQIMTVAYNAIVDQKFKPGLCAGKPCARQFLFHADLVGPDWKGNADTAVHVKARDQ